MTNARKVLESVAYDLFVDSQKALKSIDVARVVRCESSGLRAENTDN